MNGPAVSARPRRPAKPAGRLAGPIDREVAELTSAILFVAERRASTVEVCNLRQCTSAVEAVRALADASGVELELLQRPDGRGCDVAVRAR
jgi:hypothetical protein